MIDFVNHIFFTLVNYTFKCNTRRKKEVHINPWYNGSWNKTITRKEIYMNYHHLTIEERCCIREFYKNGKSFREIAVLVGRNVSTISREINRNKFFMNCKLAYYPHTAQKKYLLRRSFCHRGMFWNEKVIDYINDKLRSTWSPEQIANTPCELKMPF